MMPRDVCRLAGGPLALTSANYSAESSTLEVSLLFFFCLFFLFVCYARFNQARQKIENLKWMYTKWTGGGWCNIRFPEGLVVLKVILGFWEVSLSMSCYYHTTVWALICWFQVAYGTIILLSRWIPFSQDVSFYDYRNRFCIVWLY